MPKFNFKQIGTRVLGAAAGGAATTFADDLLKNMNPKLRAGIKIAVGAVIPEISPKTKMLGSVGEGMIGAGAADLVAQLKTPATQGIGYTEEEYTVDVEINGAPEDGLGNPNDNSY